MSIRYGSVCSGIEAATVAWHPLGWKPAFFAEIDKFPSAVLAHHYPDVPNFGDFTKIEETHVGDPIDLLVGGTPCQAFSIAGLRGGLADERGNLALEYLRLADRLRPRWLVWENVPGVLSSAGGRDFGAILGGMVELGYGFAYRVLDAQYIRVDGYPRAVPQRRNRVFVVGHLGDWRRAAAVLFEREGLQGHSAPRRKKASDVACGALGGTSPGGGWRFGPDEAAANQLVAFGGGNRSGPIDVATAQTAHGGMGRIDFESETFVAHALRAEGFDASEDGTGRGTPLIPVVAGTLRSDASRDGEAKTPSPDAEGRVRLRDPGFSVCENFAPTLDAGQPHTVAHAIQAGALRENPNSGPDGPGVQADIAYTLEARSEVQCVQFDWRVRRLTPMECERLQGFPDGYTAISYGRAVKPEKITEDWFKYVARGNPERLTREDVARLAADGPRYKALGNSMAIPPMRWIGQRIAMVDKMEAMA